MKRSTIINLLAITIIIGFKLMMVGHPRGRRPGYDSDVKSNLKNAASAQEAYFVDNGTYTTNIGSLKGYGYRGNM